MRLTRTSVTRIVDFSGHALGTEEGAGGDDVGDRAP